VSISPIILDESLKGRFWGKVSKEGLDGCWLWIGAKAWGYGQIKGTGKEPLYRAHRVSWEINRGRIPHGMLVLHHCDVPACVNPNHLFIGSAKDNTQDMLAKNRHRIIVGEQHHGTKMTDEDVREIRLMLRDGVFQRVIAEKYGVAQCQISYVKNGHTRAHV
jgi:hypothetical protein